MNNTIASPPTGFSEPVAIASRCTVNEVPGDMGDCLNTLAEYVQDGWILLWQHHAVFAIRVTHGNFDPPQGMEPDQVQHLVSARAFSRDREWFIWRDDDKFAGRKREDGNEGEGIATIDGQAKLRGVVVRQLGDRNPKETWAVQTRNYIGYNEFHHGGYVDSRFMDIIKIGKESKS